jgi:hypothetical protein
VIDCKVPIMNMSTSIFLIVCALCLGIAIGGYFVNLRRGKKADEPGSKSQASDLISLRKDPSDGALEVVVAGKAYKSASEMNSVQRTLVGYAASDLRTWLSPQVVAEQPSVSIPPATAAAAGIQETGVTPSSEPSTAEAVSEPVAAQPVSSPSVQNGDLEKQSSLPADGEKEEEATKPKRGGLIGLITRALATDVLSTQRVPASIAKQVNNILQKKLKDTPLESRGICLMELPGQEMVVMIGLDKYDSVGAVPDEEVRAVLQSAVNEWLTKSTP